MLKWIVLLSLCLHLISASFDYVYDEHSLMGKKLVLSVLFCFPDIFSSNVNNSNTPSDL